MAKKIVSKALRSFERIRSVVADEHGFAAAEVALVVGVVGVLALVGLIQATKLYNDTQVDDFNEAHVGLVSCALRELSFDNAVPTGSLVSAFTTCFDSSFTVAGGNATHALGGATTVQGVTGNLLDVSHAGLDKEQCVAHLRTVAGGVGSTSRLQSVSVNGVSQTLPLNATGREAACTASNTIASRYRG